MIQDPSHTDGPSAISPPSAAPTPADELVWTVHPLVENPRKAVVLCLLLVSILLLVYLNIPEPGWVLFSATILFFSLARFFFPTSYRLADDGIHVRFLGFDRHYRWGVYRRIENGRNGVFLSPFPEPNRLDNFRGLLLLAGRNRLAVEAYIREKLHAGK